VVKHRRDRCPVIVDVGGGWGGDAVIAMKDNGIDVVAFNGVVTSTRARATASSSSSTSARRPYWKFREALDPSQEGGSSIALPNDPELKSDRSPDRGDAAVMCLAEGNRVIERTARAGKQGVGMTANTGGRKFASRR
jgi:hypothetical protein